MRPKSGVSTISLYRISSVATAHASENNCTTFGRCVAAKIGVASR